MENEEKLYQPKEVSIITGIEVELLRKYCDAFNIITEWTKPDNKGHRRYNKRNIEELKEIKRCIEDQGWSWDQVRAYRNGEEELFVAASEKSNIEKKIDRQDEKLEDILYQLEQQKKFNETLVKQLEVMHQSQSNFHQYIDKQLEANKEDIVAKLRQTTEEKSLPKKTLKNFWGLLPEPKK